jgi:hypothetical protein
VFGSGGGGDDSGGRHDGGGIGGGGGGWCTCRRARALALALGKPHAPRAGGRRAESIKVRPPKEVVESLVVQYVEALGVLELDVEVLVGAPPVFLQSSLALKVITGPIRGGVLTHLPLRIPRVIQVIAATTPAFVTPPAFVESRGLVGPTTPCLTRRTLA